MSVLVIQELVIGDFDDGRWLDIEELGYFIKPEDTQKLIDQLTIRYPNREHRVREIKEGNASNWDFVSTLYYDEEQDRFVESDVLLVDISTKQLGELSTFHSHYSFGVSIQMLQGSYPDSTVVEKAKETYLALKTQFNKTSDEVMQEIHSQKKAVADHHDSICTDWYRIGFNKKGKLLRKGQLASFRLPVDSELAINPKYQVAFSTYYTPYVMSQVTETLIVEGQPGLLVK
ncbi:MAG: hypothetical protein ACRCXZ_06535 [Patescibacteria group bacterium]